MPSYDKEKLLLMLEEQRASMRTIRDFSERIRERRAIMQKQKQYLQSCALHAGAEEFWQYLLQLPLEQAVALPREEVESYQGAVHTLGGKLNKRYTSGISKGSWDDFNKTRLQLRRLEGEYERSQAIRDERFACMPVLLRAVDEWGFPDPEKEL